MEQAIHDFLRHLMYERGVSPMTGRSLEAVYKRRRKLGVNFLPRWTEEENQLVLTLPTQEAALRCGRSIKAVKLQRKRLCYRSRSNPSGELPQAGEVPHPPA